MTKTKRLCQLCNSKKYEVLHEQKFISPNEKMPFSYNVVACLNCGFTYATNIPIPQQYENFYKKNTKYAYQANQGVIPEYATQLHQDSYDLIESYLNKLFPEKTRKDIKILDIGCASGHQLSYFKNNGYKNIGGIDPALECRIIAQKLYGIKIITSSLSYYNSSQKFDLILLASVLEHLPDVKESIKKLSTLLNENGLIFICIPDTNKFGKVLNEPFLEFSLEHINYFTRDSLLNLMGDFSYKNICFDSLLVKKYGGYALNSIWQSTDIRRKMIHDHSGKNIIKQYIKNSYKKLNQINKIISQLIKSKEKVFIWGTGSLTSRLLANTELSKVNIVSFIDSNSNLQGKKILGKFISSPEILHNQTHTVFVSSYIHKDNILNILKKEYNYAGKIVTLD